MHEDLDRWRKEIRLLDEEVLKLSARRMELASFIGAHKKKHGMPIKDENVEKEILTKARTLAATLGLDPDFASELMTVVINHSVQVQEKTKIHP